VAKMLKNRCRADPSQTTWPFGCVVGRLLRVSPARLPSLLQLGWMAARNSKVSERLFFAGLLPKATKSERAVSIKGLGEETTLSSSEVDFRVLHLPNRKASVRTWPGAGADLSHGRIPGGSKSQKERVPDVVVQRKKATTGKGRDNTPNPRQTLGQPPADSLFSLLLWYLLSRLKMDSAATLPCRNETGRQAASQAKAHGGAGPAQALVLKVGPVEHAAFS
jgi:hypothetical protein